MLTVVMLAAVWQAATTADVPLRPLTIAHCTLVAVVQLPEVTTDQLLLATPVAGAVPQVAAVLLHCIRTLLRLPCKVLVLDCSVAVLDCRVLVCV